MANIKAGYQLLVTSWENDGDCYNTKSIEGLSLEDVRKVIKVCEFIRGSRYETNAALDEAVYKEFGLSALPTSYTSEDYDYSSFTEEDYDYVYSDLIYSLIGTAYECDYPRVLESWAVYYHPNEVQEVSLML